MKRLAGKVAVITGAGRPGGLGAAIARRLAEDGARIVISDIGQVVDEATPLEMIAKELAVAHLCKLEAETAVDYAVSVVRYNDTRIKRLEQHINQHKEQT